MRVIKMPFFTAETFQADIVRKTPGFEAPRASEILVGYEDFALAANWPPTFYYIVESQHFIEI